MGHMLTQLAELFQQIAPAVYADLEYQVNRLRELRNLCTPFSNSVFTTCEITFGDVPDLSRKNWDATFYGFEAITVGGSYDWRVRGGIIFWDDDRVFPLRPGSTVLFPAGTKRFSFVPVAQHETWYTIRQFCHASALRWVEKGGRSDSIFDRKASLVEKEAWNAKREQRGKIAAKKYSKLRDIYVF